MGSMGLGGPPMGVSSNKYPTGMAQAFFKYINIYLYIQIAIKPDPGGLLHISGVRVDPGPPGAKKSGWGHPGDKIFTDFQVRGSILTNFHEFSRFLSIFGV